MMAHKHAETGYLGSLCCLWQHTH